MHKSSNNKFVIGLILGLTIFLVCGFEWVKVGGDKIYSGAAKFMSSVYSNILYSATGNYVYVGTETNPVAIGEGLVDGVDVSAIGASVTTATSANTASTIVKRDASGNFSAGTITADVTGNVSGSSGSCTGNAATATTAGSITGNLSGDVTSTGMTTAIASGVIIDDDISASAAIVDTKLSTIATSGKVSNSATTATDANTASAIVARDSSGNFSAGTITANLTGNTSGSSGSCTGNSTTASTLATPRAIYGNNFDGSAALTQIIASAYGGTGNGFTKFTGATTTEKNYTLPNADATILYAGGALGTPSSGDLANCTFPTLNQNTTGSSGSCTGNAATATDATNADNVDLANETADTTCYLCFAPGATGNQGIKTNSKYTTNSATGAMIFDQLTNSDKHIQLYSTGSVSHSFTDYANAACYYMAEKDNATTGGIKATFFSSGGSAFHIRPFIDAADTDTTSTITSIAPLRVNPGKSSGSSATTIAATENLAVFQTGGDTRLIIKGNGDIIPTQTNTSDLGSDANAWDNVYAYDFIDKTPGFEGDAIAELKKCKSKNGHIDHDTLPEFAKVKQMKDIYEMETVKDDEGRDKIKHVKVGEMESTGRSLGAMITLLTVAVQQLTAENEALTQRLDKLEAQK